MEKERYSTPEIEFVYLEEIDVVTTSCPTDGCTTEGERPPCPLD